MTTTQYPQGAPPDRAPATEAEIRSVLDQLATLAPSAADRPTPAAQALARLQPRLESLSGSLTWLSRVFTGRRRRLAMAGAVLVAFFALFAFPGVRDVASEFLGLFRVQKFAVISVSPDQLARLEEVAESGLMPGQFEMVAEPGPRQAVGTVAAAAERVGFPVRTPAIGGEPRAVYLADGGQARLTIDLAGARSILEAVGGDPALLSDSLDGAVVDITVFPGVEQRWNSGLHLVQMPSPEIIYPAEADLTAVGEALLQFLGLAPDEAQRLAASIDWTSTLVLPIPSAAAGVAEVTVDGSSGLLMTSLNGRTAVLFWQKGGIIYVLEGPLAPEELIGLADSLR